MLEWFNRIPTDDDKEGLESISSFSLFSNAKSFNTKDNYDLNAEIITNWHLIS